jgi:AAA family ATP:ADP antiporter
MLPWLARRFRLESDETLHALVLGLVLFSLTSSYTLVKTARDALYLASLPAETLPWVYLGVGAVTLIAAAAFTRLTRRASTLETLTGTAMLSAISLAAFGWLFRVDAPWVPVALYLWVNVYGLLLMSQFWVFANSISNPREAKRIYGIVGVGGMLGGLFGGVAAPGLAGAWSLTGLMVVSAVLLVAGVGVVALSARQSHLPPAEEIPASEPGERHPMRHSYVRWLAIAALCSVMVTGILDYLFKVQIQARHTTPEALASFLGMYYTVVNLASLTMQLFVTRWALQRLGAGWSAALLPAGIGVGAAFTLAVPGFASVVATRIWDQLARQSVNRSAVEMFYFPLEPALRRRVKSMIDAGLERVGDGLAGAVILLLGVTLGAGVKTVAAVVLALIVVWVLAWAAIRRRYVLELGHNLRRMNLAPDQMTYSLREAGVLSEVDRLLESRYERVVIHAIDLMQEASPARLAEKVPELLQHPSAGVRTRALEIGLAIEVPGLRERANEMLKDPAAEVRVAALRAHAALDCDDPTGVLHQFLDSDDAQLRLTALQCVIEFAPASEEGRVYARVEPLLRNGDISERLAVAEGLGHRPGPSSLHELLTPLLRDPAIQVRRAALRSAGRTQHRMHIQTLIEALGDRATQKAARTGLAMFGDRVVGTMADWLIDPTIPVLIRREIPRVLGDVGSQEALNALFRYRAHDDVRLAYRALKAAQNIRQHNASARVPRRLVTEDLEHDARSYLFAFVHYRACPIGGTRSAERLLCIALNERMEQALDRMFRRLALLYPPRDIYAAYRGLMSDDRRQRGNAIEYLDNALSADHRLILAAFVEDVGDEGMLQYAQRQHGYRFVSYHDSLDAILRGDDSWLRACALFVVGARRDSTLSEGVVQNLADRNPQVRETALWAQAALAAG